MGAQPPRTRTLGFDIQGRYLPRISLEQVDAEVVVYRDGEKRGKYDLATQTFRPLDEPYTPETINGHPPGEWWLREHP